jgi:hypothetical protein
MLSKLDDQKRGEVTRLMGMKMEQVLHVHVGMCGWVMSVVSTELV